jgi:hypothetical protein
VLESVYTPFGYGYIDVVVPAEPKQAPPEAKHAEEDKKGEAGSSSDLLVVHLKNGATVSLQVGYRMEIRNVM